MFRAFPEANRHEIAATLNSLGITSLYILRRSRTAAQRHFEEAQATLPQSDPRQKVITHNLRLLNPPNPMDVPPLVCLFLPHSPPRQESTTSEAE